MVLLYKNRTTLTRDNHKTWFMTLFLCSGLLFSLGFAESKTTQEDVAKSFEIEPIGILTQNFAYLVEMSNTTASSNSQEGPEADELGPYYRIDVVPLDTSLYPVITSIAVCPGPFNTKGKPSALHAKSNRIQAESSNADQNSISCFDPGRTSDAFVVFDSSKSMTHNPYEVIPRMHGVFLSMDPSVSSISKVLASMPKSSEEESGFYASFAIRMRKPSGVWVTGRIESSVWCPLKPLVSPTTDAKIAAGQDITYNQGSSEDADHIAVSRSKYALKTASTAIGGFLVAAVACLVIVKLLIRFKRKKRPYYSVELIGDKTGIIYNKGSYELPVTRSDAYTQDSAMDENERRDLNVKLAEEEGLLRRNHRYGP